MVLKKEFYKVHIDGNAADPNEYKTLEAACERMKELQFTYSGFGRNEPVMHVYRHSIVSAYDFNTLEYQSTIITLMV